AGCGMGGWITRPGSPRTLSSPSRRAAPRSAGIVTRASAVQRLTRETLPEAPERSIRPGAVSKGGTPPDLRQDVGHALDGAPDVVRKERDRTDYGEHDDGQNHAVLGHRLPLLPAAQRVGGNLHEGGKLQHLIHLPPRFKPTQERAHFSTRRDKGLQQSSVRSVADPIPHADVQVRSRARRGREVLALQLELCSPRLIASRVDARWRPSGFRPGFWPQGQWRPVYSSEPPLTEGVELPYGQPHGDDSQVARTR